MQPHYVLSAVNEVKQEFVAPPPHMHIGKQDKGAQLEKERKKEKGEGEEEREGEEEGEGEGGKGEGEDGEREKILVIEGHGLQRLKKQKKKNKNARIEIDGIEQVQGLSQNKIREQSGHVRMYMSGESARETKKWKRALCAWSEDKARACIDKNERAKSEYDVGGEDEVKSEKEEKKDEKEKKHRKYGDYVVYHANVLCEGWVKLLDHDGRWKRRFLVLHYKTTSKHKGHKHDKKQEKKKDKDKKKKELEHKLELVSYKAVPLLSTSNLLNSGEIFIRARRVTKQQQRKDRREEKEPEEKNKGEEYEKDGEKERDNKDEDAEAEDDEDDETAPYDIIAGVYEIKKDTEGNGETEKVGDERIGRVEMDGISVAAQFTAMTRAELYMHWDHIMRYIEIQEGKHRSRWKVRRRAHYNAVTTKSQKKQRKRYARAYKYKERPITLDQSEHQELKEAFTSIFPEEERDVEAEKEETEERREQEGESVQVAGEGDERKDNFPSGEEWIKKLPELSLLELINKRGFEAEEHKVTTKDGYIITIQRVPCPLGQDVTVSRPAILLMHGLADCSASWVLGKAHQSLGYICATEGYDVWLGNVRGTRYGYEHEHLTPKDREFWDQITRDSFVIDTATIIKYIIKTTKRKTLSYVGHSQGTNVGFTLLTKRKYSEYIDFMAALSPAVYVGHTKSKIVKAVAYTHADRVLSGVGLKQLLASFWVHESLQMYSTCLVTKAPDAAQQGTTLIFNWFTGWTKRMDDDMLPIIMTQEPGGTSLTVLHHWIQAVNTGKFAKYDYGKRQNMRRYGTKKPPEYDLSQINPKTPIAIYHGGEDVITSEEDTMLLLKELLFYGHAPNKVDEQHQQQAAAMRDIQESEECRAHQMLHHRHHHQRRINRKNQKKHAQRHKKEKTAREKRAINSEAKNVVAIHYEEEYAHTDFIWANDAHVRIYPHILNLLRRHIKHAPASTTTATAIN